MSGRDFITNVLRSGAGLATQGAGPAARREPPPRVAPQVAPASPAASLPETHEATRRTHEAESRADAADATAGQPFASASMNRGGASSSDETSTGPVARASEPDPASGRAEGLMGLMFEQGRPRARRERADDSEQDATAVTRADRQASLAGRAPTSPVDVPRVVEARGESLDAVTETGLAEASGLRALLRGTHASNPGDAVVAPSVARPRGDDAGVEASPRTDAGLPVVHAQAGAASTEGRAAELRRVPAAGERQNAQVARERGARVTIDRLEVRVFTESPAPQSAPEPPPGAVFSDEPAGWERYHLGRGPLGF
ncbi:MAG: hypothetical protein ABW250_04430 [Pyrinomonadaceae bacterium]